MTLDVAAAHRGRQPAWTALIGSALSARVARRTSRISNDAWWARNTARVQAAQLRTLLGRAAGTEFGRAHGFARLAALPGAEVVAAYRKEVRAADWYAFAEPIGRMREQAEPDVLWPGLVRDFAQTSGTTAGDKFIPVSREMLRSNFLAAMDIFATLRRFGVSLPAICRGKALFLGGSSDLKADARGVRTADLSGLATQLIRWPISEVYAPGPKIALMSHWPAKIEAMARACVSQDIRMINGMPSWTLVLMQRVIELAREAGREVSTLRDVWPNLTAFVHGGVNYAPFESRLRRIWSGSADGDDFPCRLELYPASEGFIAMQDRPGDPGLRLLTDIGNFYEFIPLERIDDDDPPALAADRVEPGVRYVVCMTTCAGLWRYIIGDVVEFDSAPDSPDGSPGWSRTGTGAPNGPGGPSRLRIVGRHRHFINAFGENLIVEHVENAVAAAARQTGVTVGEFTAGPVYPDEGRRAGLELVVEAAAPEAGGSPGPIERFRDAFDAALKAQNVDYTTKRTDDVGMAPPTVTVVPPGSFHRWLESRGKLGGQHKVPRCANHRELIEAIAPRAVAAAR